MAQTDAREIERIVDRTLAAPARLGPVRVLAVDGPSGAGKTTVAAALMDELRARGVRTTLVPTDHFATWAEPVAWWARLAEGVLDRLARGEQGGYRALDWSSGVPRPGEWVTVPLVEVLVLEGVSAGRAAARPRLAQLCWVHGPDERARLERAVARDGATERANLRRWQRFEREWFTADDTENHADSRIVNI